MSFQKTVFSGGSYAGKTTLLSKLQDLGYTVVPEAGLLIIAQLNRKLGIDGQRQWRTEIMKRQQEPAIGMR